FLITLTYACCSAMAGPAPVEPPVDGPGVGLGAVVESVFVHPASSAVRTAAATAPRVIAVGLIADNASPFVRVQKPPPGIPVVLRWLRPPASTYVSAGQNDDGGGGMTTIDQDRFMGLVHRFVGDLGAAIGAGNVVVGHRVGLYQALAEGPATAQELARRTGTDPRYVADWLPGQAAAGYVSYDQAT